MTDRDHERAEHHARAQLRLIRQLGRLSAPEGHAFWGVLYEEIVNAFGLAYDVTTAPSRTVLEIARGFGASQASLVSTRRPELAPAGHSFWELLANEITSAWYVGYHAGRTV